MIHICYGLTDKDGRYSKFTGTSIVSVLENLPLAPVRQVTFHILHDNTLTDDNRDKFVYLVGRYGQQIKFYNVEKICPEKVAEFRNWMSRTSERKFTVATLYRLLIAQIILADIAKIIYLDSDTVVNLDISKLWNIELGEKIFAAAIETEGTKIPAKNYLPLCRDGIVADEDYFNAGVLLMNLAGLRQEEKTLSEGVKFISSKPHYKLFDQDILNYCFSKKIVKLPTDYNRFVVHSRRQRDFKIDNRILHYISSGKGFGVTFDLRDRFNKLFFDYFSKTTWFDFQMLENIFEGIKKVHDDGKNFALKISATVSGKSRIFLTTEENVEAVAKIFSLKVGEEIILADKPNALNILLEKLQGGDKILFIVLANYQQVKNILIQRGFAEDRDFIDGTNFLPTTYGLPFDTYALVKIL